MAKRLEAVLRVLDRQAFVVLAIAACAFLALAFIEGSVGSDTWLTILGGKIVVAEGLPSRDHLAAWTAAREWVDQQWLGQLVVYGGFRLGGVDLLALVNVGSLVASVAAILALARRRGASARSAGLVALGCFLLVLPFAGIRSQTLAYPLLAGLLFILFGRENPPPRRLAFSIPLLVLWANVHGSVLLASALVSARAVELALRSRAGRTLLLVPLSFACAAASPYVLELPSYYRRILIDPSFGQLVSEWQAPSVKDQPIFFAALAVALPLVARHARALAASETAALAAAAIGGLLATRNIVWFGLLALLLVPRALENAWPEGETPRNVRLNASISTLAAAVVLIVAVAVSPGLSKRFDSAYPPRALDAVRTELRLNPHVRVFANERYADWLLLRVPEARGRVAFDARFELLDEGELRRIARFRHHAGRDWAAAIIGYRLLVTEPDEADNVRELVRERGGRTLYSDGAVDVTLLGPTSS